MPTVYCFTFETPTDLVDIEIRSYQGEEAAERMAHVWLASGGYADLGEAVRVA